MADISIYGITPFDATQSYTIRFTHPLRSYGIRINIFIANAGVSVYSKQEIYTMAGPQSHVIPANTLKNGVRYKLQFEIRLENGRWDGATFEPIYFYCFKQPTLTFNNLPSDGIIYGSSFNAKVTYASDDYEPLQSYNFLLYDYNKQLIFSSESMYETTAIQYTYNGLESGEVYYLRCRGTTVHNMTVDSGYIKLETQYARQPYYSLFYAENDSLNGYVKYHTNLKVIMHSGDSNFNYDNGWIDLNKRELHYEDNFLINEDFTVILKGKNMWKNTNHILTLYSYEGGLVYLSSYIYNETDTPYLRFRLTATHNVEEAIVGTDSAPGQSWIESKDGVYIASEHRISPNFKPTPLDYIIYSSDLTFKPTDEITIFIMRINNIYTMEVAINDNVLTDPSYQNEAFNI